MFATVFHLLVALSMEHRCGQDRKMRATPQDAGNTARRGHHRKPERGDNEGERDRERQRGGEKGSERERERASGEKRDEERGMERWGGT